MGKHRWPTTGDAWEPPAPTFGAPRSDPSAGEGLTGADREDGDGSTTDLCPPQAAGTRWAGRDQGIPPSRLRAVRWSVARTAALVFLGVALAVGAALFLMRSSEPSAAAVSVQLDGGTPAEGAGDGGAAEDTAGGTSSGEEPPGQEPGGDSSGRPPGGASSGHDPSGGDPPGRVTGGPSVPAGGGGGPVVVYVTGAVASPGVVTVPAGTRLFEIITKAGGALPEADLDGINLAAVPGDGQHIHLLAVGEAPRPDQPEAEGPLPAAGSEGLGGIVGGSGGVGSGGALDINTAGLAELDSLPRVGPVLGQRIVDWRDEHGPFAQASDIDAVPGIGPALLEGILPLIVAR
ncbi:ComEA family DNA-binding protein [Arthrobacter agilis]|uniref:ComEA family DNA-binding protein n=1 Tax=Arthrobacter agilis TaxID=37921 RepID=UPI00278B1740|nr:ComEA family DNA-binding protein [Arthrobacter agilis]MDQ0734942.1 competence ComEA-like helix-hairpin-helix protein [Arthrobacter agilis]